MRILFDQGTPAPLRKFLAGYETTTAYERGWGNLKNGDLLRVVESAGFDAIITTDQNLRYQQNLSGRLAIVVLPTASWPTIRPHAHSVATAISQLSPDAYVELTFPPVKS